MYLYFSAIFCDVVGDNADVIGIGFKKKAKSLILDILILKTLVRI